MHKTHILYVAQTPISHKSDQSMETTSIVRTNEVRLSSGKIIKQPNISAASFRGNVLRRPGAYKLLELVGINEIDLPELSHVILFSGGPRLESSETHIPLEYIRTITEHLPILKALGTTTSFCMIEGELKTTAINAFISDIINDSQTGFIDKNICKKFNIDIETINNNVTEFQFNTKRDGRIKNEEDLGTIQNIFDQQLIMKGTLLGNRLVWKSEIVGSFVNSALQYWQKLGGFVGGQLSQGCGVLSCEYSGLPEAIIYEDYITKNKETIKAILMEEKIWKNKKEITSLLKLLSESQLTL